MPHFHHSVFEPLELSDEQENVSEKIRLATAAYAAMLDLYLPPGPDKTFIMRELRTLAMWSAQALIRFADGTPRSERPAEDETLRRFDVGGIKGAREI